MGMRGLVQKVARRRDGSFDENDAKGGRFDAAGGNEGGWVLWCDGGRGGGEIGVFSQCNGAAKGSREKSNKVRFVSGSYKLREI